MLRKISGKDKFNDIIRQMSVVCHMASYIALVMTSVTSVCNVNRIRKKLDLQLAVYFDENNAQLKQ